MPTFISGLPVHVLLVHAVVVLVPLAVLSTVVIAVWPTALRRHGWPAVAVTAVATLAVPLTTSSGEGLRAHLPSDPLIAAHARLGDGLLPFVGLLLVASIALVVLDRYRARAGTTPAEGPGAMAVDRGPRTPAWTRLAGLGLAVVVVLLGVVTTVQVVRIGDSGAKAAWSRVHYVQPSARDHHGDDG